MLLDNIKKQKVVLSEQTFKFLIIITKKSTASHRNTEKTDWLCNIAYGRNYLKNIGL